MDSDESAVGILRQKLFTASYRDDPHNEEAIGKIVEWALPRGGSEVAFTAAEPLIRHFREAFGWLPETTAARNVIDLATLLDSPESVRSTNDARNEWMYDQRKASKTLGEIRAALAREHPDWECPTTDAGVRKGIDAHCDKNNLPLLRFKRAAKHSA